MKFIIILWLCSSFLTLNAKEFNPINSANSPIETVESPGELVIGISNFNMKRYDEFMKKVSAIQGVRTIEYCSTMEVFLIRFEISVFTTPELAFRTIENELKEFHLFHKLGASHAELKKNC